MHIKEIRDLETEINEIISNCRSIITSNYSVINSRPNVLRSKTKDKKTVPEATLETVARDMTNTLKILKAHLNYVKNKGHFPCDMLPITEKMKNRCNNMNLLKRTKKKKIPDSPPKPSSRTKPKVNITTSAKKQIIQNTKMQLSGSKTAGNTSGRTTRPRKKLSKFGLGGNGKTNRPVTQQ